MNLRYNSYMLMLYFENDDDYDQNQQQNSTIFPSKSRFEQIEDANRNRITIDSEAAWRMALRQAQEIAFRRGDPKPRVKLQVVKQLQEFFVCLECKGNQVQRDQKQADRAMYGIRETISRAQAQMSQATSSEDEAWFWAGAVARLNGWLQNDAKVCQSCYEDYLQILEMRREQPAAFVSKMKYE